MEITEATFEWLCTKAIERDAVADELDRTRSAFEKVLDALDDKQTTIAHLEKRLRKQAYGQRVNRGRQ